MSVFYISKTFVSLRLMEKRNANGMIEHYYAWWSIKLPVEIDPRTKYIHAAFVAIVPLFDECS